MKNSGSFHISVQNIDCGYSLELPRRGGSIEYPQSMFLSRNEKTPVNLSFTVLLWGLRAGTVSISLHLYFCIHTATVYIDSTLSPRYNDSTKDVAIKMNLLLYRILNEQIEM